MKRLALTTALAFVLPLLAGVSCTQDNHAAARETSAALRAVPEAEAKNAGATPLGRETLPPFPEDAPTVRHDTPRVSDPALEALETETAPDGLAETEAAALVVAPVAETEVTIENEPSVETEALLEDAEVEASAIAITGQDEQAGDSATAEAVAVVPGEQAPETEHEEPLFAVTADEDPAPAADEPALDEPVEILAPQEVDDPTGETEPKVEDDPPNAGLAGSDQESLALLAAASKRQGGAALAEQDGLRSFYIQFGRILVQRWSKGDDGKWMNLPEEVSKMDISWMRHDGKPSSLRTFWEVNGRQVTRAVYGPRKYYWLDDGQQVSSINPETHPDDHAEVNSHRRLSETLIDVAVLAKLMKDGSVWHVVDDAAHPGRALRRTPNPKTGGLKLVIWFDDTTNDPTFVRVEPVEKGAPTMHYSLKYVDGLPKEYFSVSGAELRFPREVVVHEQYEGSPKHEVMKLWVKRVEFNAVDEKAAFAPPKR